MTLSTVSPPFESADPQILAFLREQGLVGANESPRLSALTGGVASDIWKVETAQGRFVVKRALERLRVAQDWMVPVARNESEVAWMREAARVVPEAVPRVLAHDVGIGAFAMSYLDPHDHPVWKQELLAGRADPAFAGQMGRTLGAIHAATAKSADLAARFANDAVFHAIRLEPYLEATGRVHDDLAPTLMALSRKTLATRVALVHGDVSPKNILVGPNGPVILDAECAWYGDPAFDLAFCLNHLLLKCVTRPQSCPAYCASFDALVDAYFAAVNWEPVADLEHRATRLLPALLLARIDGKSPVEYITDASDQERVRAFARPRILVAASKLRDIRRDWSSLWNA